MQRHVYYYTHVEPPFAAVAAVLRGDPARWLPEPAAAADGGWSVRLRAEGALPAGVAGRLALVWLGPPAVTGERLLIPLAWKAAGGEQRFPVLTADLGVEGLQGDGCQLSLMGTYRPPLAVVGGAADALLGHRVAEAVVRRFVLDIGDRLSGARLAAS